MNFVLAIAVGGGLGALGRHFLSTAVAGFIGGAFPWGILAVNVLGGLLIGLFVELDALRLSLTPELRTLLITGFLGGFTTFSAFSLDAVLLIERGDWTGAALYIGGSVILSIAALFIGLWLVRVFS
ncbi:MAG: fluoride efflux transporter CrcB [Proteobacteria bacterium]|nr:fluoride efflux transporter CrcB [Pseudomonadota bacterium]